MHVLGELSVEEFLRDYWQKKPVLIRNAWPDFEPLLPADELAGLSLEQEIESRLIIENGVNDKNEPCQWQLKKGPFNEEDFRALPQDKWTLLIQGVDQWIPEAADLLEHFRFIPSWRLDDLMISYAVDGGSVGPHYDQYDVFLLQAEGQREWRIGQMCSEQSPFLDGPQIRVLQDFEETDRWVLNPGDMLYLPPQLAHYGISQGECMTYSVGFRAPSSLELMQSALDELLVCNNEDQRYQDPDLQPSDKPGLIDDKAAERLRQALLLALDNPASAKRVLGKLMTEAKYPEHQPEADDSLDSETLRSEWLDAELVRKAEFARFAYSVNSEGPEGLESELEFYSQGEMHCLPMACLPELEILCNQSSYQPHTLLDDKTPEAFVNLLTELARQQLIYIAQ